MTADTINRLARGFAAEWLRPNDPDHATAAIVDTLSTAMLAFHAVARGVEQRRADALAPSPDNAKEPNAYSGTTRRDLSRVGDHGVGGVDGLHERPGQSAVVDALTEALGHKGLEYKKRLLLLCEDIAAGLEAEVNAKPFIDLGSNRSIEIIGEKIDQYLRADALAPPEPTNRNKWPYQHWLDGPCRWCGYNGEGYWQAGTHAKTCPWFALGGAIERADKVGYVPMPPFPAPPRAAALAQPSEIERAVRADIEALEKLCGSRQEADTYRGIQRSVVAHLLETIDRLRAALDAAPSTTTVSINQLTTCNETVSSRICERGTLGCTRDHAADGGVVSRPPHEQEEEKR